MPDEMRQVAEILYRMEKEKSSEEKEKVIKKIVEILGRKRRLYLLPRILESYQRYLRRKEAVLTFAREIDEGIIDKIKKTFGQILKECDKLKVKKDKSVIGGFVLKTENFLVDASIKGLFIKLAK